MRSTVRRIAAATLAVALIAGATIPTAFAGNAGSTTVYQEAIDFIFPAGTCPSLPEDREVHFTGTVHGHLHVSTDANGVVHVNWSDTITGTAIDSDGETYQFNYHNVAVIRDAGLPVEITITDHFNLVGNAIGGPASQDRRLSRPSAFCSTLNIGVRGALGALGTPGTAPKGAPRRHLAGNCAGGTGKATPHHVARAGAESRE